MPKIIHNLPITGIASFAKYPICTDLDQLDDADVCVMGIPYDMGAPYLSGTKFGPRRIREVSCHYGRGDAGFWDPERMTQYLEAPVKVVDAGDVDMDPMDFHASFDNVTEAARKIISKGALPVFMGGDVCAGIGPLTAPAPQAGPGPGYKSSAPRAWRGSRPPRWPRASGRQSRAGLRPAARGQSSPPAGSAARRCRRPW